MTSLSMSRRALLAGSCAMLATHGTLRAQARESRESLPVPFDHERPEAGSLSLGFGLLSPFDPARRTVFVVADGQQFYVTPATFERAVGSIFGDEFNVVGIHGRAEAPEMQACVGAGDAVDWAQAHRLLKAEQWIEDLEVVRRALLGGNGRIALYGRSGGALLAHQYMARYGRYVDSVFTQAAVNPFLESRFGLSSDRFWSELDTGARTRLARLLANRRHDRGRVAKLFQRQNFFVDRADLAGERLALIRELEDDDDAAILQREADYQIAALAALDATPRGPAMHVRLFEFYAPVAARYDLAGNSLHPDIEVLADYARPLVALWQAGRIDPPAMNFARLHSLRSDVTLLAGRWDHTCDYRAQIALASSYPAGRLLLLDDDHVFHRLGETGALPGLVQGAVKGIGSAEFAAALAAIEPLRWCGEE